MSDVVLPALGESVTEGTVTRWLKAVGDTIAVDEPLVEISTDKVDTEIPSPVGGVLEEILVAEDETVEVGAVLARIGDGSAAAAPAAPVAEAPAAPAAEPAPAVAEPAPAAAPAAPEPAPAAPAPAAPAPAAAPQPTVAAPAAPAAAAPAAAAPAPVVEEESSGYLTPIVRKLANDLGVALSTVTGTGVGGRITKEDILAAASTPAAAAPAAPAAAAALAEVSPLRGTSIPLSRLRKVVAERAVVSMNSTAQLTTVVEVDVTNVANYRDAVKADFLAKTGQKLSFLPFFAVAAVEALAQYPIINATVDGDSIVYPASENVSIAVDTPRGLLSPVIRNGLGKTVAQWATEIADLAERTRNNQLKPDELSGGTFSLTNTGSRGALFDTPVVFLPQSAILGTGIVTKRPAIVKVDGSEAIAIRSFVYLALSYDHRIIDGADAARFLTAVKARLEGADFAGVLGI